MAIRRGDLIGSSHSTEAQAPQNNAEIPSAVLNAGPSGPAVKSSNIEIVDSSNRRWTIPAKSPVAHVNQDAESSSAPSMGADSSSAAHATQPNPINSTPTVEKKSPVLLLSLIHI